MLALVLVLLALLVVLVAACRRPLKGASRRKVLAPVASVECSPDWQLCKIFLKCTPLKSWHYRFRTEFFSFGKILAHEQDSIFCQIKHSPKIQSVCFSELLPCEVFIKTQIFINFFSAVRVCSQHKALTNGSKQLSKLFSKHSYRLNKQDTKLRCPLNTFHWSDKPRPAHTKLRPGYVAFPPPPP